MIDKKNAVEQKIKDALTKTGFNFKNSILTLGVSGGPDSTALLASLANLKNEFGFSLRVLGSKTTLKLHQNYIISSFVHTRTRAITIFFSLAGK